ncbi:DUF4783 domain-containing protein [Marinilabiliaceae bacterium ANBcel2]|nr:DUF4783 domain-containing protein [Marinilabiliaceae bacterium ANBcel2]
MRLVYILSTLLYTMLFIANAYTQNSEATISSDIISAFDKSNASQLSEHFNDRIEIIMPESSGIYSKEQARYLIDSFFKKHPPISFRIIHQGVRENAVFAIGRYNYSNGQHRIMILTKQNNNSSLIHQIRIEKQDEARNN